MNVKIKSMTFENFKGYKNKTYNFDGTNKTVSAENGVGKTTFFVGFMWVFADKDERHTSNPPIRPLDVEECTPRVDIVLDIDGREVSVAKIQKCTKKGNSVSLSNTYEVNAVEYGERDFKAKMSEYGFDFDLFLPLSHTDCFTSQKSADMRKVLFAMASEKSDYEIASNFDSVKKEYESSSEEIRNKWTFDEFLNNEISSSEIGDVAFLLKDYTVDEVKAMQNASLRKIKEVYGKDGEILRAKIEGMESTKTDIDVAELELLKNGLNEQIAEVKAKIEDTSKQTEEYQKLSDGILDLKFAESDLQRKANEENIKHRREIEDKISDKQFLVRQTKKSISDTEIQISVAKKRLPDLEKWLNNTRASWKAENERVFDENSLICSYCGQEYPLEKKEQLRAEFESHKQKKLAELVEQGSEEKEELEKEKKTIADLEAELPRHKESLEMLETAITDLKEQLTELPTSIDISNTEEYKSIQSQIAEKEKAMAQMNNASDIKQTLNAELGDLQEQLTECEKQIALAQKNIEIDEQIAELQKKSREYEQNKANAEKILYQLDLVSKKKNEMLTDEINKHFKMVRWQMFKYQKNGDIVDDCTPLIDSKPLLTHTNGALKVLAKLDIIAGLQNFYGQYYPVFVDDFSLVTSNTEDRIDMPCQLIKLRAVEGVKEIQIV